MIDILRRVPKEERKKIVEAVENIDKNSHKTTEIRKDIEYLFEIWNEYVQPSNPQSISCPGCRTNVFSQYKHYTKSWKESKEQG